MIRGFAACAARIVDVPCGPVGIESRRVSGTPFQAHAQLVHQIRIGNERTPECHGIRASFVQGRLRLFQVIALVGRSPCRRTGGTARPSALPGRAPPERTGKRCPAGQSAGHVAEQRFRMGIADVVGRAVRRQMNAYAARTPDARAGIDDLHQETCAVLDALSCTAEVILRQPSTWAEDQMPGVLG